MKQPLGDSLMVNPEVRALCAQIAMRRNEGIYDTLIAELSRVLSKQTMPRPTTAQEVWPSPSGAFPPTNEIARERPLEEACTTAAKLDLQVLIDQ